MEQIVCVQTQMAHYEHVGKLLKTLGSGSSVVANQGYWKAPETYDIYKCLDTANCLGVTCSEGSDVNSVFRQIICSV